MGYLIRNISFLSFNKSLRLYIFRYINIRIWFKPFIFTIGSVKLPLEVGMGVLKSFDQGWSEYFGGQKIYFLITYLSVINQYVQNNNLKIYVIIFLFWVIFLVLFILSL